MTTAHIPAWKKIGLKVKEELSEDPLALTTHITSQNLTNKQTKSLKKQKRSIEEAEVDENGQIKSKKPPKRQKLPKTDRPAPPEKDQLVYLRQYHEDKENWKFSKQKQNWILKNVKEIPNEYLDCLKSYLGGLQGGSRTRVVDELKKVIEEWNKVAEDAEKRVYKRLEAIAAGGEYIDEAKEKEKEKEEAEKKDEVVPIDADWAIRAKRLVKAMSDEDLKLIGLNDENEEIKVDEPEQVAEISEEDSEKEESEEKETRANLIVETVEVSEFVEKKDFQDPVPKASILDDEEEKKSDKKGKKEKKSKKAKKSKN